MLLIVLVKVSATAKMLPAVMHVRRQSNAQPSHRPQSYDTAEHRQVSKLHTGNKIVPVQALRLLAWSAAVSETTARPDVTMAAYYTSIAADLLRVACPQDVINLLTRQAISNGFWGLSGIIFKSYLYKALHASF